MGSEFSLGIIEEDSSGKVKFESKVMQGRRIRGALRAMVNGKNFNVVFKKLG